MKRKVLVGLLVIIAAAFILLPACGGGGGSGGGASALWGNWIVIDQFGGDLFVGDTVFFSADNQVIWGGALWDWYLDGGTLWVAGWPFTLAWINDYTIQLTDYDGFWMILEAF